MMVSINGRKTCAPCARHPERQTTTKRLSAHSWLALADLCDLPKGAPLEHVTVVSGRGGRTGLPDMYFGNAAIGVVHGSRQRGRLLDASAKFATVCDLDSQRL